MGKPNSPSRTPPRRAGHTPATTDASGGVCSPGVYGFTAQFVDEEGQPYPSGAYVELVYGVRPALWLDAGGRGGEGAAG